jgi:vancomycin resistance protein YoaR
MADSPQPPLPKEEKRRSRKALAKERIKVHYDTYMPNKKHHRVLVWVVFFVCSATVALQLLYPPDRALPLTRITGQNVAWRSHEQLAEMINTKFRSTKLKLTIGDDRSVELPLATAGAEPNTEPMIEEVVGYPFWQRFIPFSILLHFNDLTAADVYYTDSVLKAFAEQQAKQLSFAPVNARLAIENGKLTAASEKRGSEVTAKAVRESIARTDPSLGGTTVLTVAAKRTTPAETASSLQAVRAAAEAALSRQVTITAAGHNFTPDSATVAAWLQIGTDDAGKSVLRVADDKINGYFDTIDAKTGIPAGRTNINLTDGRETSRTTGSTGRAIDREDLKLRISNWLLLGEGQPELGAAFRDVAPSIMYDNKYTATEEGLRAYVADASGRMNVQIAIQQIDGGRWTASAKAEKSVPSASTYKLFVSKWLFDQMDKGVVHWDDPMLDTTVSTCFDRMTIASTNPCAESWLAQAGRSNFNQYIYGLGFSQGTSFTMTSAAHTTANDLQRMMLGLNDGSIIGGAHRDRLLHSLSIHPYRYGIPTGSAGQVWDKVGFLWDYVHDTAIVKHPKGTYVMTIMTRGQSYATIASLTREIERIMYP